MLYAEIDYKEILPYKETYNAVCKTIDGGRVLYEIEQSSILLPVAVGMPAL